MFLLSFLDPSRPQGEELQPGFSQVDPISGLRYGSRREHMGCGGDVDEARVPGSPAELWAGPRTPSFAGLETRIIGVQEGEAAD